MKIFIDIGHPHEVHFYKNFIKKMTLNGHEFVVSARNRDCIFELLKKNNIVFFNRGKGSNTLIGKIFYLLKTDILLYKLAKKHNPDIFIGFASFYIAHISWMLRKPSILFNDTEHSFPVRLLYLPFCNSIITPESYLLNHGKKHYKFKGFKEIAYLAKEYHSSNQNIKKVLNIREEEKYIVLRFISKKAFHDILYKGFTKEEKIELVQKLEPFARIFISSESPLPDELEPYKLNISPSLIHDVLEHAAFFIGEGATMAAEAAILGIPSIYNYMRFGYLQKLEEENLLTYAKRIDEIIDQTKNTLNTPEVYDMYKKNAEKLKNQCIDMVKFMEWLVENHPNSLEILRENPGYQYKFK